MRRDGLLILILFLCLNAFSQEETARFEVPQWGKEQDFRFVSFHDQGGMVVYETDQTDEENNRLWNFITVDTNLNERRSDLIPLPGKLSLFGAKSSSRWAAFVFLQDKPLRSDTVFFYVVCCHLSDQKFSTFLGRLPERSKPLSVALLDGTLMIAVNKGDGGGFLAQYDLESNTQRVITPEISEDFLLFQFLEQAEEGLFVLAAREYVEKRYKATSFLVFDRFGHLREKHRYENGENSALGRMCFSFDSIQQLVVYATLEREGHRKVDIKDITEDFNKEAVGVTWIKFASSVTLSKTYLFKNIPDIDRALNASDRVKVREEQLKMQQGKKQEKGEVIFQFLTPRLVEFGGNHVFVAEAFEPVFHRETRMEYGFYGTYPVYYTVFDGYNFLSELLLAFDDEGALRWHQTLKFDNDLSDRLAEHAFEAVSHDELVVVSPSHNKLRYEVFDEDGTRLLDQQTARMEFLYVDDTFEDEYDAGVVRWFGSRFLVQGCQKVQNPRLRNTHRTVYFLQKMQYE